MILWKYLCHVVDTEMSNFAENANKTPIPVKSYVFSISLTDFRQFSSLTAYGEDLMDFPEKMTK